VPENDADHLYERLPRRSRLRRWWYQWARTRMSVLAVLVILATAAALTTLLPRVEQRNVSGTVRCMSGNPVVGVYVHDSHPRSGGWARTVTDKDDPAFARYQRDAVIGATHSLSVGCGGDSKNWARTLDTREVKGEYHEFLCFDQIDSVAGSCDELTTG
jgi:hypothetical protein